MIHHLNFNIIVLPEFGESAKEIQDVIEEALRDSGLPTKLIFVGEWYEKMENQDD